MSNTARAPPGKIEKPFEVVQVLGGNGGRDGGIDLIRLSEGKPAVAVLNGVLPRGTKHEQAADIIQGLQLPVCPASLGQRVAFDHASTVGQTAQEYDPHGRAATEIK